MKKKIILVILTIVILLVFLFVDFRFEWTEAPNVETRSDAHVVNNSYLQTIQYHLDSSLNKKNASKIVVLNSWATWCTHCIREMTYLNRIQQHFQNDSNIVFLSDCTDSDIDSVKRLLSSRKLAFTYDLINAKDGLRTSLKLIVARTQNRFSCDTNHDALPTNYIFDKRGKLLFYQEGGINEEDAKRIINMLESSVRQ